MTFSRTHLGMLGVVSIFTGIISPVISGERGSYPLPLTELQIGAYTILLLLAGISVFLAVRSWLWVRITGVILFCLIGYLGYQCALGDIVDSRGDIGSSLSWGWVFYVAGGMMLTWSMIDRESAWEPPSLSDHILGWLSAVIILILTGVIIDISHIPREETNQSRILSHIFGDTSITSHSGVTQSMVFQSIDKLSFERSKDDLNFFASSGNTMIWIPYNKSYPRIPLATTTISSTHYIITASGEVLDTNDHVLGYAPLQQDFQKHILFYSGETLFHLSDTSLTSYSGQFTGIEDITFSSSKNHTFWKMQTGSGYALYKDGKTLDNGSYKNISLLSPSPDGTSMMALIRDESGSLSILKNGVKIETIAPGYKQGSLRMNGTNSIYTKEQDGYMRVVVDGKMLDSKLDEVREIFIADGGSGYAYFGRPLGEKTYCLYTQYKGNLCGLTGYMNPRKSPDGISILYAGLKDGNWGIYSNATPIIKNTGYPNYADISHDYVFFDITNPRYFLFIHWEQDGYRFFKKGEWITGVWKDIGLDTSFGYDGKIIMSAQDQQGWRILEF